MPLLQRDAFTLDAYDVLVRDLMARGYICALFTDIPDILATPRQILLLRHDVEIDIEAALRMAQHEHALGVRATYFFAPGTPFYSLFSASSQRVMLAIQRLGHDIGLHVEATSSDSREAFALNPELYCTLVPMARPGLVSTHSPRDLHSIDLELHPYLATVYATVVTKTVAYLSDSGGEWANGNPLESSVVKRGRPLQLLTHPVWWAFPGESPVAKIANAFAARGEHAALSLREYLPKFSKKHHLALASLWSTSGTTASQGQPP